MRLISKTLQRLVAVVAMLGAMSGAQAICFITPANTSTSVTGSGSSFDYAITATALSCIGNSSFARLTDFYLPYFADMGIQNVQQSEGWSSAVEASNDLFGIGGGVLHFSWSGSFMSGYSVDVTFQAAYGATPGVVALTTLGAGGADTIWLSGPQTGPFGNALPPVMVVGSPDAIAAMPAVPEPATYAMLFAGLALMGVVARKRAAVHG